MTNDVTPSPERRHAWQQYGPLGERWLLALVNTVDDTGKSRQRDALPDQVATVEWGRRAEILEPDEVVPVQDLLSLRGFREDAWQLLAAAAANRSAPADPRERFEAEVQAAVSRAHFVTDGIRAQWLARRGPLLLQDRIALDAASDLLTGRLSRLHECDRCTALFLDSKQGATRRFCRTNTCGNRDKVARHRARRQQS